MAQPPYDPYGYGSQDPYAQYQAQPAVQHHHYGPPSAPPTNGMATASMVCGLIGIVFCGFTSILAIIFGHVAQSQIRRTREGGSGMATAGLVMGYIVTAIWGLVWLLYFIGVIALAGAGAGSTY
ncbi:DUF4190 domain-containing protein [Actinomadura sp. WAC 06369]|uniref:DUF4190 domain-containing protein n=1 Tax=Actinomadura sp. WAC 06369 TaxID=2203193 RepID=UPI000F7A279F|nr:DUF4190 domain-containing protein [Actinomadura sp. WAC 06369]RSN54682.1 DUF4190 domain-containing protein [Actinomadura sp. WAC 06369]